jgi:hypothetical protein
LTGIFTYRVLMFACGNEVSVLHYLFFFSEENLLRLPCVGHFDEGRIA